jgi:uncharacterized membrane protein YhaH (DUF805 family)
MGFADAIKTCFSKYVDFSGRARRSEFWFWILFDALVSIAVTILDSVLGSEQLIYRLTELALFLPGLAVAIRRLHDTGRSGWWILLVFAIIVGWIMLLVWFCQDSEGDNQYGPNPKGGGAPTTYTPMSGGYGPPPVA